MELVITPSSVDWMFNAVLDVFCVQERDAQIGRVTVMLAVCRRLKAERDG
jgi:hypothetical protein